MSKWDLPSVDLHAYVEKIREMFEIEEGEQIDYETIKAIPNEIDRRRTLVKYFIPNIFAPGKYDRQADLIDGCIYYLEFLAQKGFQSIILDYWVKRLKISRTFGESDLEEDTYGYTSYHPIWHILGIPQNPGIVIPRLIKYIQCFKGRKRKLDINDYSLIFFSIFNSAQQIEIKPKMITFLQGLLKELEKVPLPDGIDLKKFMQNQGFKDVRSFLAELNKLGVHVFSSFEYSTLGIDTYTFLCPFPNHVRVKFRSNPIFQNFLTGGQEYLQEISTGIPSEMDWKRLYQKFPSPTQCFRMKSIRATHQPCLRYFDPNLQNWVIPWNNIVQEWHDFLFHLDRSEKFLQPQYGKLEPSKELLEICTLLEQDGNRRNRELYLKTKVPIDRIEQLRLLLDLNALIVRTLLIFHSDLMDFTMIMIDGTENWKYQILMKLGEIAPNYNIYIMEDLLKPQHYLVANYLHTPKNALIFLKAFTKVFHGLFDYKIYKRFFRMRIYHSWFQDLFDPETNRWVWNPDDYEIIPISFKMNK